MRLRRLAVLLLLSPLLAGADTKIETVPYRGWSQAVRLSNGDYSLVIVPEIGGRIMAYSLEGKNVLWGNADMAGKVPPLDRGWINYGGHQTGLGAQSDLPGAPDPVLDRAPASLLQLRTAAGEAFVRVVGAPQLEQGLVVFKDIRLLPDGSVLLSQHLRNFSNHPVHAGPTGITQVPAPAYTVLPLNPGSRLAEGFRIWTGSGSGEMRKQITVRDLLCIIDYKSLATGLKMGADSPGPWLAWFQGDLAFVKHFNLPQAGRVYPNEGCSVQVYTSPGKLPYVELEITGDIQEIAPGAETVLEERWTLQHVLNPVKSVGDAAAAVTELQARGLLEKSP